MNQPALLALGIGVLLLINPVQFLLRDGRGLQQEVPANEISEDFQIGGCIQNGDQEAGALAQRRKGHGQVDDGVVRLFQVCRVFLQLRNRFCPRDGGADLADHVHGVHALVLAELPADQVEGLDAVRPLVEAGDLAVSHVLLDGVLLAVAVAAVHVDGLGRDQHGHVGRVGLAHRGEELHESVPLCLLRREGLGHVEGKGREVVQGADALRVGLHPEQVPANVRMLDDGNGLGVGVLHLPDRRALDSFLRVCDRVLESGRGVPQALHPHFHAGLVHHLEHDPHAFALLAQKFADAVSVLAEVQGAGRRSLDAHLVLDVPRLDVVELAQRAVILEAVLGNDEDGDAGGAGRIAFNPGQDRVNDVRGQVVVSAGDEAFGPGDQEFAVGKPLRRCPKGADVAARARLGEAHRAAPLAGEHFVHVFVLQLLRPVMQDQSRRAVGQSGIHQEGEVGGIAGLQVCRHHGEGQPLAADIGRLNLRQPSGFAVLLEGVVIALGHAHLAALEGAAFLVPNLIGRQDDVERHLFRLVHHHQHVVLRKILVELRFEQLLDAQLLEEKELLIPCVYQRIAHKIPPSRSVRWSGNFYSG